MSKATFPNTTRRRLSSAVVCRLSSSGAAFFFPRFFSTTRHSTRTRGLPSKVLTAGVLALVAQRPFSCQRKKGLSAEDSLHLSWLKPLGRRPCRESGPPQSLQLGPSPKVRRESGLPQSLRSIPEPKVRRESGQPQSLQPSQDRLP